jgi:hypothetical protein
MHCIIAGSRTITDYNDVANAILESGFSITEVISGGAKGADRHGEEWARIRGIKITRMVPDWNRLGRSAGVQRNRDMAQYAVRQANLDQSQAGLILVWDGQSKGSASMWATAQYFQLVCFQKIIHLSPQKDLFS